MAAVTWTPPPVAVHCHGEIAPDRDEDWGKTRYHCQECGRDLQVRDDLLGQLFTPLVDSKVADVPLAMLLTALKRTRR